MRLGEAHIVHSAYSGECLCFTFSWICYTQFIVSTFQSVYVCACTFGLVVVNVSVCVAGLHCNHHWILEYLKFAYRCAFLSFLSSHNKHIILTFNDDVHQNTQGSSEPGHAFTGALRPEEASPAAKTVLTYTRTHTLAVRCRSTEHEQIVTESNKEAFFWQEIYWSRSNNWARPSPPAIMVQRSNLLRFEC